MTLLVQPKKKKIFIALCLLCWPWHIVLDMKIRMSALIVPSFCIHGFARELYFEE
jgi:hypothetical protein